MAITYIGVTTAGNSAATTLASVSRPSTTLDDILVLDLYLELAGQTIAFSNGSWTPLATIAQAGSAPAFSHYRSISKYEGVGTTFTISWDGTNAWRTATVRAYRGVDLTVTQDVAATGAASGTSSTSATAPTLTTVTDAAFVLYCESDFDGRTFTVPTGTTPTYNSRSDFANMGVADGELATAGATGAETGTLNLASWNTAGLIAFRPAGTAPAAAGVGGGPHLRRMRQYR